MVTSFKPGRTGDNDGGWNAVRVKDPFDFRLPLPEFVQFLTLPSGTGEPLNITTLPASRVKSPPVVGFLPLRGALVLAENLPKPLIRTSSPDSRAFLMCANNASTRAFDCCLESPARTCYLLRVNQKRVAASKKIKSEERRAR